MHAAVPELQLVWRNAVAELDERQKVFGDDDTSAAVSGAVDKPVPNMGTAPDARAAAT